LTWITPSICYLGRVRILRGSIPLAVALLTVAAPRPGATAPPPEAPRADLDALLGRFSAMPGLYAEFREEKHLDLLEVPLVNTGTLHYADGAFARHVRSPSPSSLVVMKGRLAFADATGREELDLRRNPVAALFVESFTKILAGDRVALEAMYAMQLHASGENAAGEPGWKLDLVPRVAPLDEVVVRVEVAGHGIMLESMRVLEVGGDETITTFSAVDTNHRYSASRRREIFAARPGRPTKAR